jgi:Fasciclin domain
MPHHVRRTDRIISNPSDSMSSSVRAEVYVVFARRWRGLSRDPGMRRKGKGTVKSLLKPENKQKLTAILTYHVVAGNVKAADVIKLSSAKTLNGQSVMIKVVGGKVLINGATVVKADIAATNGTIHVIDTVLMPK